MAPTYRHATGTAASPQHRAPIVLGTGCPALPSCEQRRIGATHGLLELRDGEPAGAQVLRWLRSVAGDAMSGLRCCQRAGHAILWRMRHAARRRGRDSTSGRTPHQRGRRRSAPIAQRRLVSILFADLVGFTTLAEGHDAEDTRELLTQVLRSRARRHRALWRHGREVHRRRGDGGLGSAHGARGRRRAGGTGQPRSGGRGAGPRPRYPGQGRCHDRRSGGHARCGRPGDGRRRPRQYRQPAPIGSSARHGPGRGGDAARCLQGDPLPVLPVCRAPRQGNAGAGARVASRQGGRGGRWPRPIRCARGAVRGSRGRAAVAQGAVPRHEPRGPHAAGQHHRSRRHRQDAARLGVPEVHRRSGRDGVVA